MQSRFKWILKIFSVKLLVIGLAFAAPATPAGTPGIPAGWESYLSRPDILSLAPRDYSLSATWAQLKKAHFSFLAELLELYSPDTHIYFLARDAELLYDAARLATEGTADFRRIHLLNVSTLNLKDENLEGYLAEHGISEQTLSAGKKVLFIDTGFSGSVPQAIAEHFSEHLRRQIKTHLIVSGNPEHPSARTFLIHLNPAANDQDPSLLTASIANYERMERYTDRSTRIFWTDGHYHPISVIGQSTDGAVSKMASQIFMQDLKAEWQKPETKAQFESERFQQRKIINLLADANVRKIEILIHELEKYKDMPRGRIREQIRGQVLEAQIRDTLESQKNAGIELRTKLEDLGLTANIDLDQIKKATKRSALIKKFPEWAAVLENPRVMIPKLFTDKNWPMIANLVDANVDYEINILLTKSLYGKKSQDLLKEVPKIISTLLRRRMIEIGDEQIWFYLAESIFSQPHTKEMTDLLRLLIERGDPKTLMFLAESTFSQPHTKDMLDLLRLLIERGNGQCLIYLAIYTFSQPFTKTPEHQILLRSLTIANSDERAAFIENELLKINSPRPAILCRKLFSPAG